MVSEPPAPQESGRRLTAQLIVPGWRDIGFWGDAVCLLLAAPPLYFPGSFPVWAALAAIALLIAGWIWRRQCLGYWLVRTPADWPIFLIFVVMLPVAIWAAPTPLREEYSIPRALILLWNFCLFWLVVVHSSRGGALRKLCAAGFIGVGVLIALAALFGTQWVSKIPVLTPVLSRLPQSLVGVFAGAEEGFSPNQLAGSLLYVLPFVLALLVHELRNRRRGVLLASGSLAALVMGVVFLISQSRSGYVGLAVSLAVLGLGPRRWGRWLLCAGVVAALVAFLVLPLGSILQQVDTSTRVDAVQSDVNMAGRIEIWTRAFYGISDFPLTGMGLGTFRRIVPLLYPLFTLPPSYDIAHAHNFFLQSALDFGLPGLMSVLAIYIVAVVQAVSSGCRAPFASSHAWALGLLAALAGQAVFSLSDAVAMGAKTNLLLWVTFALIFGVTAHLLTPNVTAKPEAA